MRHEYRQESTRSPPVSRGIGFMLNLDRSVTAFAITLRRHAHCALRLGKPSGADARGSAATLTKTMRQKETFLPALCTHIATHTRHWERQGWRLSANSGHSRTLGRPVSQA